MTGDGEACYSTLDAEGLPLMADQVDELIAEETGRMSAWWSTQLLTSKSIKSI